LRTKGHRIYLRAALTDTNPNIKQIMEGEVEIGTKRDDK
jgi:hypothetical protein